MKLVVGLGNIGKKYAETRHNVGFNMLDNYLNNEKWQKNSYGLYIKKADTIFLKPSTFMNLSGNALFYFVNYYKIDIEDIIVIYDDMDIELGNIKIKEKSSSGGHNGIKSVINSLGSNEFVRIKIGISKNNNVSSPDHVLGNLNIKEKKILKSLEPTVFAAITDFISEKSADYLMNKYN